LVGRYVVPSSASADTKTRTTYTNQPPRRFLWREKENNDVDATGPIARTMEMHVWAMPFVAPSECLLGAAERT
jgi:hypothetical protein